MVDFSEQASAFRKRECSSSQIEFALHVSEAKSFRNLKVKFKDLKLLVGDIEDSHFLFASNGLVKVLREV